MCHDFSMIHQDVPMIFRGFSTFFRRFVHVFSKFWSHCFREVESAFQDMSQTFVPSWEQAIHPHSCWLNTGVSILRTPPYLPTWWNFWDIFYIHLVFPTFFLHFSIISLLLRVQPGRGCLRSPLKAAMKSVMRKTQSDWDTPPGCQHRLSEL